MLPGPLQLGLLALCLIFATPLCCAFFVQRASIKFSNLEKTVQEEIGTSHPEYVYYNKGL